MYLTPNRDSEWIKLGIEPFIRKVKVMPFQQQEVVKRTSLTKN